MISIMTLAESSLENEVQSLWSIVRLPFIEVILIGAVAGLVGAIAVLHQRIFFTESVTHGTFPGAVLGVVVGVPIVAQFGWDRHSALSLFLFGGAALMCLPMSWIMHRLARVPGKSSQAAAGIVLTFGFALGYFLSKWFQPLPLKTEEFLTGSVLNVNRTDIWAAAIVLIIALLVIALMGNNLVFFAFDTSGYRASGRSVAFADGVILTLICLTIVVLIPAVGTILPVALIAAPAAGLKPLVKSTRSLFLLAPITGSLISVVGLWAGVHFDLSVGGLIAITAGLFYLLSVPAHVWVNRCNSKEQGRNEAATRQPVGDDAALAHQGRVLAAAN